MKHITTKSERKNYLSLAFDKLDDQDQANLEALTAKLAEIHQIAPEKQISTGIKSGNKVQLHKEQKG